MLFRSSATATAIIAGQTVRAKAQGLLKGSSLDIQVGHDLIQDNSAATATADASAGGGAIAVASASAILAGTGGTKVLKVGHDWKLLGSTNNLFVNDTATGGAGAQPDTLVGTTDSSSLVTSTLTATVTGQILLIGGVGPSGTALTVMGAGGEIKLTAASLLITGDSGSGLIRTVPGFTERLDGTHPPITVNGSGAGITIIQDPLRNSAIVLSGAPPTNLDALQSTIISAIQATSSSRSAGADNDVNAAKNKPVDGSKICK